MCRGKKVLDQLLYELLSPGTQDEDLGRREPQGSNLEVEGLRADFGSALLHYIQSLHDELQAFQLVGNRYQAMESMAGRIGCQIWNWAVHYGKESIGCIAAVVALV